MFGYPYRGSEGTKRLAAYKLVGISSIAALVRALLHGALMCGQGGAPAEFSKSPANLTFDRLVWQRI